ncbi:MAG: hypothetical protein J5I90_01320 [Caldilineales bacterium]|nr:hypothetical protein [Caldilineales bacterium]
MTRTLPRGSSAEKAVLKMNRQVIAAMSLKNGVTHAEFIRGTEDGAYYFLEIAARVGGANIDRLVEAAAGINPWAEWARLLVAEANGETYVVPETRKDYAGIVTCLARQEWPDTSAYTDPEIIWRLQKKHHAGLLVGAADAGRVEELLWSYAGRFEQDFLAITPPPDSIRY